MKKTYVFNINNNFILCIIKETIENVEDNDFNNNCLEIDAIFLGKFRDTADYASTAHIIYIATV